MKLDDIKSIVNDAFSVYYNRWGKYCSHCTNSNHWIENAEKGQTLFEHVKLRGVSSFNDTTPIVHHINLNDDTITFTANRKSSYRSSWWLLVTEDIWLEVSVNGQQYSNKLKTRDAAVQVLCDIFHVEYVRDEPKPRTDPNRKIKAEFEAGKFRNLVPQGVHTERLIIMKNDRNRNSVREFVIQYFGGDPEKELGFMDDQIDGYSIPWDSARAIHGYETIYQKASGELAGHKYYSVVVFHRINVSSTNQFTRYVAWMDYDQSQCFSTPQERDDYLRDLNIKYRTEELLINLRSWQKRLEAKRETSSLEYQKEFQLLQMVMVTEKTSHNTSYVRGETRMSTEYRGKIGIIVDFDNRNYMRNVKVQFMNDQVCESHGIHSHHLAILNPDMHDLEAFHNGDYNEFMEKHNFGIMGDPLPSKR